MLISPDNESIVGRRTGWREINRTGRDDLIGSLVKTPNHGTLYSADSFRANLRLPNDNRFNPKDFLKGLSPINPENRETLALLIAGAGIFGILSFMGERIPQPVQAQAEAKVVKPAEIPTLANSDLQNAEKLLKGETPDPLAKKIRQDVIENGYKFGILLTNSGRVVFDYNKPILRVPVDIDNVSESQGLDGQVLGTVPFGSEIYYSYIISNTSLNGKNELFALVDERSKIAGDAGREDFKRLSQWVFLNGQRTNVPPVTTPEAANLIVQK